MTTSADALPQPSPDPVLALGRTSLGRTEAAVLAGGWCLLGLVLIGPSGGLLGAIGGLALWLTRRRDLPALTALATIAAVGLYVTINERRWAPLPDGGWPVRFEAVHDFGMFAAVSLLVAALAANDREFGDESSTREEPMAEHDAQLPSPM